MRDERGNIFSFDLFFSSTSENARTHKRSLENERQNLSMDSKTEEEGKKFSAPTSVPLLCKDQVKRSKKIRTKSLGFKCLSCTQISLPECFFLTRRAKIQKNSREFYNRKR